MKAAMMMQFEGSGGNCWGVYLVLVDTEYKILPKMTWVALEWIVDEDNSGESAEVAEGIVEEHNIEEGKVVEQMAEQKEGAAEAGKAVVVLEWDTVVQNLAGVHWTLAQPFSSQWLSCS